MDFKTYQSESLKTAIYPNKGANYIYPTLGLVGEAGEVAENVKKILRDDNNKVTEQRLDNIKKELGDVLWYLSQVATEFNLDLDDVAKCNLEKLNSRKERGVLGGSGDNR